MTAPFTRTGGAGGAPAAGALRLAYACFSLLGTGMLFPWNALITAADYWESRYPGKHTDRLFTVVYLPADLLTITAMVLLHGRIRPRPRILGGLVGFTLALMAVTLMDLGPPTNASLAVVLCLVAACGVCDGFLQGAMFGETALLPPIYTQALVGGTAVSGIAVSLLRVATKATLPATPEGLRTSAILFFGIAVLVLAACTAVYSFVLPNLSAVQHHRQAALEAAFQGDGAGADAAAASTLPAAPAAERSPLKTIAPPQLRQRQPQRPSLDLELSCEDQSHWHVGSWSQQQEQQQWRQHGDGEQQSLTQPLLAPGTTAINTMAASDAAPAQPAVAGVMSSIWRLAAAVVLMFTVTLCIFPGVIAEDEHSASLGSWYPVLLITSFNVADWAGKGLPGLPALRLRSQSAILTVSVARALFIPAFRYATVSGAGPAVIGTLTMLLGCTNGYCCACALMEAPAAVPPAAAPLASNIIVLFLVVGLCSGAAAGFLWLL